MASVQNIGFNGEKIKAKNEQTPHSSEMAKEISLAPLGKTPTRESSYWFAHSGPEDVPPGGAQPDPKAGGDREDKVRRHLEQQEAERARRGRELELQLSQNKRHREQQEEERRRRIEEARLREQERRQQVEERKRQIWEAEQERKEAILRRNMEREARIEARRNAQRNSQCFAFGSSTPRSFDLDLAAIGVGNQGSVLMCSVSRRPEERELGPPRATSACSLDRKFENVSYRDDLRYDRPNYFRSSSLEPAPSGVSYQSKLIALQQNSARDMKACLSMLDSNVYRHSYHFDSPSSGWLVGSGVTVGEDCMSRSMVSLSSSTFRGRKRTDILPTMTPRERSVTPHATTTPRGKDTSRSPPRPHSSLSGTSDISVTSSSTSAVQMRPRPAPRRPRPFSVAGSIVDTSTMTQSLRKDPERQPRLHDRNAFAPAAKPQRAKSANRESSEFKNTKPLIAPRKPVPPPKPTELLAKAKSHPVPIKDNLRKVAKPINKSITSEGKLTTNAKEKLDINQNGIDKVEYKKEDVPETGQTVPTSAPNPSSTVTSPTSDSDMLPTSNDSEANGESDADTLSQSIAEHKSKAETPTEETAQEETVEQSIPKEAPSKEDVPSQSSPVVENGATKSSSLKKDKEEIPASMTRSLYVKKEKEDIPASMTTSLVVENGGKEFTPSKPRITSEEEARTALAEKRRLAREQAEREAELERQRLEEIERKEEEERRLEELEQKRMEDEQIRLAELHRQLEHEKLAKAIEEQQQREKEEQEKREEEARQKAEREEQEKKAREEAEKQRVEMEEKLRKEEEERAERKRRVEQIMARTRGKTAAQSPSNPNESKPLTTPSPAEAPKTTLSQPLDDPSSKSSPSQADADPSSKPIPSQATEEPSSKPVSNGVKEPSVNGTSEKYVTNSWPFSEEDKPSDSQQPLPDLLNSGHHNGSFVGTEEQVSSKVSVSSSFTMVSNRTLSANEDVSPQTNGYSSHEEMSCTTSPEESADMGLLIDIQSCQQRSSKVLSESVDFTKLVEVDPPSLDNVVNNENYLIHVDDVNSNLFNSANPFTGFEDSVQQKQDTPVTDLLS